MGEATNSENLNVWEARLPNESAGAFRAFCMFKAMGYRRSIKGCLEAHGIEARKYGTWARWSRLFDWKNRAAAYDEFIAKETEKEIISEHVEHRKCFMQMIGRMAKVVDESIGKIQAKDIDADTAMDLLERSAKLDGFLNGKDGEKDNKSDGQLEIRFVDEFKGV